MMRQPRWNIYEAVVLLDGYLETLDGKKTKSSIIRRVSEELRNMALQNGMSIDEVYRNENGISYQIQSMDSAYRGSKVYVPATKLFAEVVEIYRTDYEKYNSLLMEARSMTEKADTLKDQFMTWLSIKTSKDQCNEVMSCYLDIENFCMKLKVLRKPLFETTDLKTIKRVQQEVLANKFYHQMYKKQMKKHISFIQFYLSFIKEYLGEGSETASQHVGVEKTILEACEETSTVFTESRVNKNDNKLINEDFFREYLKKTLGLADASCRSYVSAIHTAEIFAKEYGFASYKLYETEKNEIVATVNALLNNQEFLTFNSKQHNRLSAALTKLLESVNNVNFEKESTISIEQNKDIIAVLKKNYSYGFRIDSIREMIRFRQFAELDGISLPEDDECLRTLILASGTLINGKVFCSDDDISVSLKKMVDDIFEKNINVIYYESLYEVEFEWMNKHNISSEEMLKELLLRNVSGCVFSKKFMTRGNKRTEREAVTDEIINAWGIQQTVSVDELNSRLPYIPLSNIWRVISGNSLFVLSAEGEYLYIDRLHITEKEVDVIKEYVEDACNENGFASLSDIPLIGVAEENYELSLNVIQNAIYKIALSDKYYINGKILTKEKGSLDAVTLLKEYLAGRDSCTFAELSDKVVELIGVVNRQYVFQALYDCMVRIDEDHFVANTNVAFDVAETDRVLKSIITDRFCALREITTFALFPVCGQSWNHYLLESYCYKYSMNYSLHILNFNDKNAGIIAEKEFNKSYSDMLALALSRRNVDLKPEIAGAFLCNSGYMAKSKYAKLDEIVAEAQTLRKEG